MSTIVSLTPATFIKAGAHKETEQDCTKVVTNLRDCDAERRGKGIKGIFSNGLQSLSNTGKKGGHEKENREMPLYERL